MDCIKVISLIMLFCLYCNSAEVLKRSLFIQPGQTWEPVIDLGPLGPLNTSANGYFWAWLSHSGQSSRVDCPPAGVNASHTEQYAVGENCSLTVRPKYESAGTFTLRSLPANVSLAEVELSALRVGPAPWPEKFPLGSDVSLKCQVSRLPDGSTLQWERDPPSDLPPLNATDACPPDSYAANSSLLLSLDRVAYMLLRSVDPCAQGNYSCSLRKANVTLFSVSSPVRIETARARGRYNLYRHSNSNSSLTLPCDTPHEAQWFVRRDGDRDLPVVNGTGDARTSPPDTEISGHTFNGTNSALYLDPLEFEDAGRFTCLARGTTVATVDVVTVRVSVASFGQQTQLSCEVSNRPPLETDLELAWMRMKGEQVLMVMRKNLSKNEQERMFILTASTVDSGQQEWSCLVFTEAGLLRALAPLKFSPIGTPSTTTTAITPSTTAITTSTTAITTTLLRSSSTVEPEGSGEGEGVSEVVIAVVLVVVVAVATVLGGSMYVWFTNRRLQDSMTHKLEEATAQSSSV